MNLLHVFDTTPDRRSLGFPPPSIGKALGTEMGLGRTCTLNRGPLQKGVLSKGKAAQNSGKGGIF